MSNEMTFQAGLRSCLGSPENTTTLEILEDQDGNFVLVIQEHTDIGNMRSQGVRIEHPRGDPVQMETWKMIKGMIIHIHEAHRENPKHPVYVVEK